MFETWHIFSAPKVLTDAIFIDYGGRTGTSTAAQRTAAYTIAEQFAMEEIGTFLTPTTITGTFSWPEVGRFPTADYRLQLPHNHIINIINVIAIHDSGCDCADDAMELTGCAWLLDADNGLIDLRECGNTIKASCSGCICGLAGPFQLRIVYAAGLPANMIGASPAALMGLATAADLALGQIIDSAGAEGGPGDPGVQSFGDAGYSEIRFGLLQTAFGNSARANFAARMFAPFKFKGALKL